MPHIGVFPFTIKSEFLHCSTTTCPQRSSEPFFRPVPSQIINFSIRSFWLFYYQISYCVFSGGALPIQKSLTHNYRLRVDLSSLKPDWKMRISHQETNKFRLTCTKTKKNSRCAFFDENVFLFNSRLFLRNLRPANFLFLQNFLPFIFWVSIVQILLNCTSYYISLCYFSRDWQVANTISAPPLSRSRADLGAGP